MDIATIIVAILAVGLLIIVHEAGHYFAAKWSGMAVSRFSIGFGPAVWKTQRGETTFQFGAIPLGGYVQIDGMNPHDGSDASDPRAFPNRPLHQRFAALFAGSAANYLLGFLILVPFFALFHAQQLPPVKVKEVIKESAAEAAGLKQGDLIVGTSSATFQSLGEFLEAISNPKQHPLQLVVERDGVTQKFELQPKQEAGSYRIGVAFEGAKLGPPMPWPDAFAAASVQIVGITIGTAMMLPRIPAALLKPKSGELQGPVGIVRELSEGLQRSGARFMSMVAQISIAVGVFNLLPLPGLDGSRLLFLIFGAIRRRPVPPEREAFVHGIGLVLLLAMMIVVTVGDVLR